MRPRNGLSDRRVFAMNSVAQLMNSQRVSWMSSLFIYLLFGISVVYLATAVPILRAVERWRWGMNRLRLMEMSAAWGLANMGAFGVLVTINILIPNLRVAGSDDLADVFIFGLGLLLTLLIFTVLWLDRRLGRSRALKASAVATAYFLIFGIMVFVLHEVREWRYRWEGAVSARCSVELRQKTLTELTKGIHLDFPDTTRLVWAYSMNSFDQPKMASVIVELPHSDLPGFLEQIGAKGLHRLADCSAGRIDREGLSMLFYSWGPRKWWRPESARHFEVWTGYAMGHPTDVLIDFDDAWVARVYIVYGAV